MSSSNESGIESRHRWGHSGQTAVASPSDVAAGAVTMMFTDIEGSTRLVRTLGDDRYRAALDRHEWLIRDAILSHGGEEIATRGDGFFVVFAHAGDAVRAAVEIQRALTSEGWPTDGAIRVRIGVHTGEPSRVGDSFVGLDVHQAARLCGAGHGGQILLSGSTYAAARTQLPDGVSARELGNYRLRDMPRTEAIWQLDVAGLRSQFAPLQAADSHAFNLPTQRTSFIGREHDVATVRDLLMYGDGGIVTLTGPAGTGKTRLALAVAVAVEEHFEDGVCFVGLASVAEPDLVVSAIVRALGLQEAQGMSQEETLRGYLRDRHMLLILDNFEHLLRAAPVVADLLATCPRLKVLATSRSVLRLYGEQDFRVPPLALPDLAHLPPEHELDRFSAVALFAQRARAVRPEFAISPENGADVANICARLDGLPLAIELAAARIGLLSARAMLRHLEDAKGSATLDLLTAGPRDVPTRHQTLRDAIGWSYDLLDPAEQALFRRLAIFVGGFTLDAALVVAPADAGSDRDQSTSPADAMIAILNSVASLVDKSLLQKRPEEHGAEPRFFMLETMREYGLERLEAEGELDATRRRHAAYFAALAEEGERWVRGSRQAEWLARLDEEYPNLRSALAWSLVPDGADVQLGTRLAGALWVFWYRRGSLREGSRFAEQALAVNPHASPLDRAKLRTADGAMTRMRGEFARAETLLEEGAALYRGLGDPEGLGWALSHLGLVKQWLGHLDEGVAILEESLALRRPLGDARGISRSLFQLAVAEHFRQSYERAAERYAEALEFQRRLEDNWGMGRLLGCLGKVALVQGQVDRAAELFDDAWHRSGVVEDHWGIAQALAGLGSVAAARGDLDQAAPLLKEGLTTFRDVGSGDRVVECIQDLASLAKRSGAVEQAVRLWGVGENSQRHVGLALWPEVLARRLQELAVARAELDAQAFARAWSSGLSMTLEQGIDDALTVRAPRSDAGADIGT
jgi:predicted ATPase/class 3 adenylate cyclase